MKIVLAMLFLATAAIADTRAPDKGACGIAKDSLRLCKQDVAAGKRRSCEQEREDVRNLCEPE